MILDEDGRIVLLRLTPKGSRTEISEQVEEANKSFSEKIKRKAVNSKRGDFKSASFGISMGCGQRVSGPLFIRWVVY